MSHWYKISPFFPIALQLHHPPPILKIQVSICEAVEF